MEAGTPSRRIRFPVLVFEHETTKRLHIKPECRAMFWYREQMTPQMVLEWQLERAARDGKLCAWCFRVS